MSHRIGLSFAAPHPAAIAPDGIITTVAGDGDGLAGDGGPAAGALLSFPTDVAATRTAAT